MTPFLKAVAEDLYNKVNGDLSRTAVVFPNKRAGLFFNEWLTGCTEKPLWTPTYLTISELFRELGDLQIADPIRLVCTLYPIFCQETGNEEETLDNFYFWGEMLIADFDDLDKNLVDADQIFQNLRDLRRIIDDHSYLTEEQREALALFFHNFPIEKKTEQKEKFITLWDALGNIYCRFKETLAQSGLAYEGQLYRSVTEQANFDKLPYERYVFVGFNVLNRVEHKLFSLLQAQGKAMFYWDYDESYMPQGHEAGEFLRRNLNDFANELTDKELFNNLKHPKKIEYIAASTENAQARYVPQWLADNLTPKESETAIVLCNESLLQPVLHALPTDKVKALNITMGYPLSSTPVFSLLTALTDLYTDGYNYETDKYTYRYVSAVLKHPYVRRLSPQAETLEKKLTEQNRFFPLSTELQTDEVLTQLFPTKGIVDEKSCCDKLLEIIRLVASLYRNEEDAANSTEGQLNQETLFRSYTRISRLGSLIDEKVLTVGISTLARLIKNLLASLSVPFHGEPAIGLQIMGVLETRNLDFRHVMMLSVNEGQLPKQEGDSSFIPYNLRRAFGMTTIEHKNAVYAYYFYRLIQRAERVTMLYNTSSEELNRGEMSRFMLQYLIESNQTDIRRYSLLPDQGISQHPGIEVQGSEEISSYLRQHFGKGRSFLSPSALNVYLDCPLKFYFRYVCKLYKADEVTTDIDSSVFGNIFHKTTEIIYKEILASRGNIIRREDIERLLKEGELTIRETVNRAFNEEFFKIPANAKADYDGLQLLNKEVIITYIHQLLLSDAEHAPFTFVAAEYPIRKEITVTPTDGTAPFTITMGGSIDRMDEKDGYLRIIDYKTGTHIQEARDMEQLFNTSEKERPYHIFQTFLYATLLSEETDKPITPALFYIQKAASADYSPTVKMSKQTVDDFTPLRKEYTEELNNLLSKIFSANNRFYQTTVSKRCTFCDFARICNR